MLQIVGYADRFSARPDEKIAFKISCETGAKTYRADLVRLICGDDRPNGPGFKAESVAAAFAGDYPGRQQLITTGSYVQISAHRFPTIGDLTVAALIKPTRPVAGHCQSILSQMAPGGGTGFDLRLDSRGRLQLRLAQDGNEQQLTLSQTFVADTWYLVTISLQTTMTEGRVVLSAHPLIDQPYGPKPESIGDVAKLDLSLASQAPLLIGAALQQFEADRLITHQPFDGKIEAPAIYQGSIPAQSISAELHPHQLPLTILAAWDFSREIEGSKVVDISGHDHHGKTVNLPARAVTGHAWCGQTTHWRERPELYGAIHFHSDDLYDACWETDFSWTVPTGLKSGIYAARLRCGDVPEAEEYIPFFVLPPRGTAAMPVAFLASTFTYLAYANSHHGYEDPLSEPSYGRLLELGPAELFLKDRRDFGVSLYDRHLDGSGACYSSARRPILNTRPKRAVWNFNADLHIIDWLEATGQAYDVITDDRLHAEGLDLLKPYRCILTGTHPEYHSTQIISAIGSYLQTGGRLMYLGGNGFYWRVATHPDWPDAIEVRRGEAGTRCHEMPPGERYHSFTGEFGGLWRSQGLAPQHLVGVGYVAEGFDQNSHYIRLPDSFDPRAAFIFDGIEPDEKIGDFGSLGGAAGYELDAADTSLGTPRHALVLARSVEHTSIYLLTPEELLYTHPGIDGIENDRVRAELVFFECKNGGAVFSTGSITWASALAQDAYHNNVARITGNVLRRFLDPTPLEADAKKTPPA